MSKFSKIKVIAGDITTINVDAIVNAANRSLLGGGGVDGAIHRAAGLGLFQECQTLGGCSTGSSKITKGYNLPAKYVIHTVGPIYRNGQQNEPALLASCYRTAIELANETGCRTVAFPAISCGAYCYPIQEAARIAFETVAECLMGTNQIEEVYFVMFDPETNQIFQDVFEKLKIEV